MAAAALEGYSLEDTLGSGHFGIVKLAYHDTTGAKVAVKVIDKTKLDARAREHLFREVSCMKRVEHPNIIRLYQVFDTPTKLYLVLELGENGDLYDYIANHPDGVGEDESRDLFRQIAEAVFYCHKLHVVHRDLKPENVVFCQNASKVKLTDFGLSNLFDPGAKLKTSCGSLSYSAPEILLGDTYDAPAVDRWSLGVILYMLLVGEKPFVGGTDSETLTMIMDCKFDMPSELSRESVDLVQKLLVSDPKERISLEDVLCHPWMTQNAKREHSLSTCSDEMHIITGEDRTKIIQGMIARGIGDKEQIDSSLESNSYDYVATTYYLLAAEYQEKKRNSDDMSESELDMKRLDLRRRRVRKASVPGQGTLIPDSSRSSGILAKRSLPAMPLVHRPSSAPMPTFMPVTKEEDNGDDDEDKRLRTPPSTSPWRTLASTSPTGNTLYSLSEMSGSYSRRGLPFPTTPASTTPHSPVALGTKRQSFPVGTSRSAHSLGIRV
ncbi:SNF-related serine/threonine-protein kinase-like [Sycon ciliatum]|uniref:SNF-related serine/threonine-protein kinase-like n=1 Tax=Sycon ciliatum TaxID=27933 RepID=UPI0031F6190D